MGGNPHSSSVHHSIYYYRQIAHQILTQKEPMIVKGGENGAKDKNSWPEGGFPVYILTAARRSGLDDWLWAGYFCMGEWELKK